MRLALVIRECGKSCVGHMDLKLRKNILAAHKTLKSYVSLQQQTLCCNSICLVLYHIYRAIGSKKLKFHDGIMIHFDSHPDLVLPKAIDLERILDKDYLLNSLSIENWIMPSVYAGHFNTLLWMKPVWATQIEDGLYNFKIGQEKLSKEMKVTCTESYFVSELSWCPEKDLQDGARDVTLQVCTLGSPLEKSAAAESKPTEIPVKRVVVDELSLDVKEKLEKEPFVLDIDLDFYSTRNPFLPMFTPEQFDLLRKLYHYNHPKERDEKTLSEVTSKRREQLSELKSIFQCVRDGQPCKESGRLSAVRPLLNTFPDGRPPDPDILNDAGCTCDDCDLPHHVSSKEEVRHLVNITKEFLLYLPKPAIITIARSSRDDYCPPEDVDFIQDLVLEMLGEIYGNIEITRDYETDEDVDPHEHS